LYAPLPWWERVRVRGIGFFLFHPHLNPPPSRGREQRKRMCLPNIYEDAEPEKKSVGARPACPQATLAGRETRVSKLIPTDALINPGALIPLCALVAE